MSRWFPALVAGLAACSRPSAPAAPAAPSSAEGYAPVTHGVAAGDATSTRAVVWARTDRHAKLHVRLTGPDREREASVWVEAAHDFAGKVVFDGLTPGTRHDYAVWFTRDDRAEKPPADRITWGTFRTAPDATVSSPVTFGWSGDLGGLNVCRDAREGYPVFGGIDGTQLDFFVGLGDMIYADFTCEEQGFYGNLQIPRAVGKATTIREYWAHWKYNREDPGFRRLLASTAYVGMWDDHEVVNDFAPGDAWHAFPPYTIGADLLPLGRRAMLDENPIYEDPADPVRLYRSFRWGKHLEVAVIDTRSYRDSDGVEETPDRPKTLLGRAQRAWLEALLARSDATWKVVVSSVPISIPTGRANTWRDGWTGTGGGHGRETELRGILTTLRDAGVRNVVFVTTDVHFATGFVYTPFPEAPDFVVYEFSAGPLGAMLLPTLAADSTFHPERLFFFGPERAPLSFDEAKRYMNWGRFSIDARGLLRVSVVDGQGAEVAKQELAPAPSP